MSDFSRNGEMLRALVPGVKLLAVAANLSNKVDRLMGGTIELLRTHMRLSV